ncbi:MAG TPA: glycosyltransferase, partial [Myxococcaceae bacterium]|nr:glycosyltransferase [Myxococcaceae bacterium]
MSQGLRAVLGIQGTQSAAHGERGIARYILEHALALSAVAPERLAFFDLDPTLPLPTAHGRLLSRGQVWPGDRPPERNDLGLYHVMSPMEGIPVERIWPRWAQQHVPKLVVTLYDLIPLVYSHVYLADALSRRWYMTRLEMLRSADAVLAISEHTARDGIRLLGLDPEKVTTIHAGCSDLFQPTTRTREDLLHSLRKSLPTLQPDYFFYTGGVDFRKNLEGLIAAYSLLPAELRAERQLVITCKIRPEEAAHFQALATSKGVGDRVLLTGFVPDPTLVELYQACGLFVFPSLYEGFGLPVIEALKCGAPSIVADASSLKEIVGVPEARFDPTSPSAIAEVMARATWDRGLIRRIREDAVSTIGRYTWENVARHTEAAYARLSRPRRVPRPPKGQGEKPARRFRLAMFTPMPPQATGIADYSYRLIEALAQHCDVDVYVEDAPWKYQAPPHPGVHVLGAGQFETLYALNGYDRILYCMGNSEFHLYMWPLMQKYPGDVLAHEMRFIGIYYCLGLKQPGLMRSKLAEMYGSRVPPDVLDRCVPGVPADLAHRYGIYMSRELLGAARRVFVHSEYTKKLAAVEGDAEVQVVPFGYPAPAPVPPYDGPPVLVSFGIVGEAKHPDLLIRAFALLQRTLPDARLVFAGNVSPQYRPVLEGIARQAGIVQGLEFTGWLGEPEYRSWLARTTVAVQLRNASNGEMSASVADCLSAGLPTVVSDVGPMAALPRDVVVSVPGQVDASVLAR